MIEDPRPLVFALAKLGLSHSTIAHSFGLITSLLRLYFSQELIQAATEAEIEALASLHPARNTTAALFHLKQHRPSPQKPDNRPSPPAGIEVVNNDGEPNDDL
jgi:hypothetical protein